MCTLANDTIMNELKREERERGEGGEGEREREREGERERGGREERKNFSYI